MDTESYGPWDPSAWALNPGLWAQGLGLGLGTESWIVDGNNGESAPIPPITTPMGNTIGNSIGNSIGNTIKKNPDFPDTPFTNISMFLQLFMKKD